MTPKTYKVVRTGQFNIDVARLSDKVRRLDEFIKGAEEVLSRNPEWGKLTKNRYIFAFKMRRLSDNPPLTAYYYYTRTEVRLIFLRIDGEPNPPPPHIL
jgi:hypothetical protein